jgi:hypothetical protein
MKTHLNTHNLSWERVRTPVALVIAVALIATFAIWGGMPSQNVAAFWVGVVVVIAAMSGFVVGAWHLLIRPLPRGQSTARLRPFSATIRQLIAILLGVAGVSIIVGAFWDEVWHRQYGIPFGEDFFWRPHLMLYFGLLSVVVLGFASYVVLMRSGQGTMQQRFRASPTMGLLVLASGFMLFAMTADPLWHSIYGEDISAWSLPHLLIVLCFGSVMLLSIALYLTTQPARPWAARLPALGDLLPLLMYGALLTVMLQLLTTEWDGITTLWPAMRGRPEWLLPALLVLCAGFVGAMANHSLRSYGGATLAGVAALALRSALLGAFELRGLPMTANAWLLTLPVLIGVDLGYALAIHGGLGRWRWLSPQVLGAAGGALGMIVVGLPAVGGLFPVVSLSQPFMAVGMIIIASLMSTWAGKHSGDYLATSNKQVEAESQPRRVLALSALAFVGMLAFVIFFINTATPPI